MKHSNSELIVVRYYKLKNWLVEKDIPILSQKGKKYWSDLDVLAVGDEVHLISCKDYLPNNKDIAKVITNLEDSYLFIKKEYQHLKDKDFKKIYVYGGTSPTALKQAQAKGIITIEINEMFARYIKYLDDYLSKMNTNRKDIKIGKRYFIIGELEGIDKYNSFLLNNDYINTTTINKKLSENNTEGLSVPYRGKTSNK